MFVLSVVIACTASPVNGGAGVAAPPPPAASDTGGASPTLPEYDLCEGAVGCVDLSGVPPLWTAIGGTNSVLELGDVTGDGLVDVRVGIGPEGVTSIVAGPLERPLDIAADRVAVAEGYAVGATDDITGDGVADVYVIANGSNVGFRIVAGPVAGDLVAATPELVLERAISFGDATFDGISDVVQLNEDSTLDVIAGPISRFATATPHFSMLYEASPEDGETCNYIIDEQFMPWGLLDAGDIYRDGTSETLLAASEFSAPCPQLQHVVLEPGLSGALVANTSSSGGLARTHGVSAIGDQDGDGHRDLLLNGGPGIGMQVFSGPAQNIAGVLTPGAFIADLPTNYRAVPDVDGDGLSDWLLATSRSTSGLEWVDVKILRGGTAWLGTSEVIRWWAVPGGVFRVVDDVLLVQAGNGVHVLPLHP